MASLIVVMRLWRVIKIIEEISLGAQEQNEKLNEILEDCKRENEMLKKEISQLRGTQSGGLA